MEILLGITVICILIIAALLLYIKRYKHQLRVFSKYIRNTVASTENQEISQVNSPVTVETFNRDIVDLANALNEYRESMRSECMELRKEREHLQNVIAGISHDFRTPLTSALGYMQMLDKSADLNDEEKKYLKIAGEKTLYMKKLSDDFFEVSAISARNKEITLEQVNISRLLSEQLLAQYEWISDSGIDLRTEVEERNMFVIGNEHILERMIDNIFSNARKYAVSELIVSLDEDTDCVRMIVDNDIDKDMRIDADRVFEPFYRSANGIGHIWYEGSTENSVGNKIDARNYGGSGLGLYIVKQLAECIGADVKAKVTENRFEIEILVNK
ncbi:MAG: HAMP domain-containing histidine kinase [Lachnospiraceae bacterium]|nr:HAMP domain-containing histidine kinase [Lachnospiraceae bacterium]